MIRPNVGDPGDLILDFIDSTKHVHKGQAVVTAGWRSQEIDSRFPPNIPIGEVTRASIVEQEAQPAGARAPLRRPARPRPGPGPDRGLARMILTPKILARLVAIVVLGVLLQLSFFSQVALFHVSPDVLPALVVSLGLLGGTHDRGRDRLLGRLPARLPADRAARRRLAGPARHRLPGRALPRALRDPQPAGAAAALHGPDPVRRARLRRRRADARRRRPGQRPGRPRHADQEPSTPSSSAGRSTSGCGGPLRPALVEEPAVRRPRRPTVLGA